MKGKFFECPKCKETSTAGEWNVETLTLCKMTEQKRTFVRIQFAGMQNRFYQCPKCKEISKNIEIRPQTLAEVRA